MMLMMMMMMMVDAADDGDDGDDEEEEEDEEDEEGEDEDENEDDDPEISSRGGSGRPGGIECGPAKGGSNLFLAKARATSASTASFREQPV